MDERPPEPPPVVVRRGGETLAGARMGDRRVRVPRRPETQRVTLEPITARRRVQNPALVFVYGFAAVILVGAILLVLPVASATGQWTSFLDALFTSTSAVCVTGLVVVDTGTYWSPFGQVVILLLIQVGGFGFMTSSTLLLLLVGHRASLRERILLTEALGGGGLGSARLLARKVIIFTFIAEGLGALFLTARFLTVVEPERAVWWGVFHSVSAFNNAGFDLFGEFRSVTPFSDEPLILLPIAILIIFGGISYTFVEDLVRFRRFNRLTLDSKLVLVATIGLIVGGTLMLLFTERGNPGTLAELDPGPRLLNAFFMSVAARTAGFNSIDMGAITEGGLIVLMALMFIGGASGSTAGGIKIQTFSVLFFAIVSAVRGLHYVEAFRREVPVATVLRSISVALLAIALVMVVTFVLSVTDQFSFLRELFEVISAFATVGLSTGITPDLSAGGRVLMILTMFTGRLGPLTLALALAARERRTTYHWPEEAVKIG